MTCSSGYAPFPFRLHFFFLYLLRPLFSASHRQSPSFHRSHCLQPRPARRSSLVHRYRLLDRFERLQSRQLEEERAARQQGQDRLGEGQRGSCQAEVDQDVRTLPSGRFFRRALLLTFSPFPRHSEQAAIRYQLVQDLLDILIPAGTLGYHHLDDGVLGLIGTVTSLMGLRTQIQKVVGK
jgi:hypothetical protein